MPFLGNLFAQHDIVLSLAYHHWYHYVLTTLFDPKSVVPI